MSLILSGTDGLSDVDGTAATPAVRGTDTNTGIFFPAADTVAASVGGTEGLRLTTTGLGVATSTPNSIGGNSNARYFGLAGDGTLSSADGRVILSNPRAYASIVANSTTAGRIYFQLPNASTGTTTEAAFIDSIASGSGGTSGYGIDIRFGPKADNGSANERMRLDQAGNLGLGVTPSAWSAGKAFEMSAVGNGVWCSPDTYLIRNCYYNGGWKYASTAAAANYYIDSTGQHIWSRASSGTAGNTISFTQAMTLNASGNLGVGTTTINYRVVADCAGSSSNDNGISVYNDNNSAYGGSYNFEHKVTSGGSVVRAAYISSEGGGGTSFLRFATTNASTLAERIRITSGGDLLVGGTSGDPNPGVFIYKSGAVSQGNSAGASGFEFLSFRRSGTQIGTVTQNGTTAVAYNTSSDYRLKHDIAPMTGALAKVALLKPCTYKWNADDSAGEGFIAHELAEVCPQAVTGEKDAVDADGNPKYQGIDTSFLVATLTAAIQEQQAMIQQLQAEVAALKGT